MLVFCDTTLLSNACGPRLQRTDHWDVTAFYDNDQAEGRLRVAIKTAGVIPVWLKADGSGCPGALGKPLLATMLAPAQINESLSLE
jgi:hypothetical protein